MNEGNDILLEKEQLAAVYEFSPCRLCDKPFPKTALNALK